MNEKSMRAPLGISSWIFGAVALIAVWKEWIVGGSLFASLFFLQLINQGARFCPPILAQIIHWARAMSIEILALIGVVLLHPFRYRQCVYINKKKIESGKSPGTPILLIHGYLHDCSSWMYHGHRLKSAGLGPLYALNLGSPFRSIRDYAKKISEYAEMIEKETGRDDLILIGHSMGGLVAFWYALFLAPGKVTDLVAIGSPLAGTYVAHMGIGPNAREMEPQSQLIQELQQEIKKTNKTRFYQIATRADQIIIPQTSALIGSDPKRQFVIEDVGHIALLFSPRVADRLCQWLIGSKPLRP